MEPIFPSTTVQHLLSRTQFLLDASDTSTELDAVTIKEPLHDDFVAACRIAFIHVGDELPEKQPLFLADRFDCG